MTFCTSHSSGLGSSAENLHALVPERVTWLESRRFPAGASREHLKDWLEEIGLYSESGGEKELTDFLPQVTITPALVQNEIHPYYQERDVVPFIQEKGIVVQCWYPLGGRGHTATLLGDEAIKTIAEAHGVSSAQVILRWDLQRGIVVIPGSSDPKHIKENLDLFGFALTGEEMEAIAALDRGEKHDWY